MGGRRLRLRPALPLRLRRMPRSARAEPSSRLPPPVGRSNHVMTVEFIGMISTQHGSEIHPPSGPVIDAAYTRRFARAHEDAGFDRVLIGYGSGWPEGSQVAPHVAAPTQRPRLLIAPPPGFLAPTPAPPPFPPPGPFSPGPA